MTLYMCFCGSILALNVYIIGLGVILEQFWGEIGRREAEGGRGMPCCLACCLACCCEVLVVVVVGCSRSCCIDCVVDVVVQGLR